MIPNREKVIAWLADEELYYRDHGDTQNSLMACNALALLKEQEAVKPVRDEQTGRMWLCGKCGSYVGFEDNDPYDPNEFDKYCRECGRPVLWEGR